MTSNNTIQAFLDKLKEEFIGELPARIEQIESLILKLDRNNNYEEIYRHVHSLKGAGGTHGLQIISVICHHLETYLQNQNELNNLSSTSCIDHCLKYIDLLAQTHKDASNKKSQFARIEMLLNQLSDSETTQKYTALVVETSKLQIDIIKKSLSPIPLIIETLDNGLNALELLLHKKYDILITGMEVNELNGEALISAMRLSKSTNKNTKSILLTSKNVARPGRMTDPDKIIQRSTELSRHLLETVKALLNEIN